ncbi:NnrU protein, partial [Azospirillum brasilense]|nr:NnrU protein [Azospirillum brasilense]
LSLPLWGATGALPSVLGSRRLALRGLGGRGFNDPQLARRPGAAWDRSAGNPSNLPFAAILAGRHQPISRQTRLWRPALALLLYGGLLHLHRTLFGVSPLPW